MKQTRVQLTQPPFNAPSGSNWGRGGTWPAHWISVPATGETTVAAYKIDFSLPISETLRVHVSGDERYELFLDGQRIGLGPERGDIDHWSFESYDLEIAAGKHVLVARVFSLGGHAAFAQFSVRHGFLLCPDDEKWFATLATGVAPWQVKVIDGYQWLSPLSAWGTGANTRLDGRIFAWGHEKGESDGWGEVQKLWPGARSGSQLDIPAYQHLIPAQLPAMLDEERRGFRVRHIADTKPPTSLVPICAADHLEAEVNGWQALMEGTAPRDINAHTTRRVVVDLEEYCCARPEIVLSGGRDATVRIHWSEALYENLETWSKGHRGEIEAKYFTTVRAVKDGVGDVFIADGAPNRKFQPFWWQAGRYLEIVVETQDEPLRIESFLLRETRYPLESEAKFACSDERLGALEPLMIRALQMCSHETYMDCPFYEQLMYVGDTRLEALLTYVLTTDDALPKKALRLFDWSRLNSGLTQSRYPSRFRQIIPPFSLWWVNMVHDYALWRGEPEFMHSLLPGVRSVCDYFAGQVNDKGLMDAPDGWNFADWVKTTQEQLKYCGGDPKWPGGVPPTGATQVSGVLNWQAVVAFQAASEIETWFGEPELAALQSRRAKQLATAIQTHFWNEERGLFADDLQHQHWSEHAQCLALLSGLLDTERASKVETGLFSDPDLVRTTIYFSHYLLEACRITGRMDAFFQKMELWFGLVGDDLKTTVEMPEPTRSDCHAWGAHPLFHFYATLAGIRPIAPGFSKVEVKPQLGELTWLEAAMPHPQGEICVVVRDGKTSVSHPKGVILVS